MEKSASSNYVSVLLATTLTFAVAACGKNESPRVQPAAPETSADSQMIHGATPTRDGSSSKLLKAPIEQFGSMDVTPSNATAAVVDSTAVLKTPAVVSITAHSEEPLKVTPTSNGEGKIISNLSGRMTVTNVEPDLPKRGFSLTEVIDATFVTPDIGACQLQAKNFDNIESGKTINFTLIGSDDADVASADGCIVKLSTMAMAGFVVEFKNVRVGGPLSDTVIPMVRLTVAPSKQTP